MSVGNPQQRDEDETFDAFWAVYPKRVGKGQARVAWRRAIKKTDPGVILLAAEQFAADQAHTQSQFVPYPGTWLNGERWADEKPVDPLAEWARSG